MGSSFVAQYFNLIGILMKFAAIPTASWYLLRSGIGVEVSARYLLVATAFAFVLAGPWLLSILWFNDLVWQRDFGSPPEFAELLVRDSAFRFANVGITGLSGAVLLSACFFMLLRDEHGSRLRFVSCFMVAGATVVLATAFADQATALYFRAVGWLTGNA